MLALSKKIKPVSASHRETMELMLTNFRVGDCVEDKETHKRGVTLSSSARLLAA
jgi:hypothetical protein